MMLRRSLIVTILVMLTGVPCAASEPGEVIQRMSAAEDAGDRSTMIDLFSENAVFTMPDERPFIGRDAITTMLDILFSRFEVSTTYSFEREAREGETFTTQGQVEMTWRNLEGGDPAVHVTGCLWELERVNGEWLVTAMVRGEATTLEELMPPIPSPTGPFEVGLARYLFEDEAREEALTEDEDDFREVAVGIWYPAQPDPGSEPGSYSSSELTHAVAEFFGWPAAFNSFVALVGSNSHVLARVEPLAGRMPVLIYNHGYSGFTSVHQILYEDLASHGYMVVSVGHAHESSVFILPDGSVRAFSPEAEPYRARLAEASGETQEAAKDRILMASTLAERRAAYRDLLDSSPLHQQSTRLWAADCSFVLDRLEDINAEPGLFFERIDLDRVGALGHSLGGATAGQLALVEGRVDAGINLDGFQFGDLIDSHLKKPFLFMGAQRPWAGEAMISNDIFFEASTAPAHIVLFRGFEHGTFSDLVYFGGVDYDGDPARALELQRSFVLEFFDVYLRGASLDLLVNPSDSFPEAITRSRGI